MARDFKAKGEIRNVCEKNLTHLKKQQQPKKKFKLKRKGKSENIEIRKNREKKMEGRKNV